MALYGDLRRIVTCDADAPEYCGLTDRDAADLFTKERRVALRDIAAGKVIAKAKIAAVQMAKRVATPEDLKAAMQLAGSPDINRAVSAGRNSYTAWATELVSF